MLQCKQKYPALKKEKYVVRYARRVRVRKLAVEEKMSSSV